MTFNSRRFWAGPMVVAIIFSLFYYNRKRLEHKQIQKLNEALGFTVKQIDDEVQFKHAHRNATAHPNFITIGPWIEAMGAGVTVADFNNDGFMDMLVTDSANSSPNDKLFINNRQGKFEDRTRQFKLDHITNNNGHTKIIAFDCNKDGFQDLLIQASSLTFLYINHQGKFFTDATTESGIPRKDANAVIASTAFDYDKDGNLDIIWGNYFANQPFLKGDNAQGILPDNFSDSKNAASITLMKGDGKCHFTDASNLLPENIFKRGWFIDIGIADIFQEGNQDIWMATDYGITHPLRFVSSNKGWVDESNLVNKPTKTRNSMGVNVSDLNHEGVNYFFLPNIYRWREKINGNLLWHYEKDSKKFIENARDQNIQTCGWAWGSQFIDLNNDTWDDLVVTNGMFGEGGSQNYWYSLSILDSSGRAFMSDYKNWPDMRGKDLDGAQRDCIFVNLGRGRGFVQVDSSSAFDADQKNGRGVAYLDMNNDGYYQLVVANQDSDAHMYKVMPIAKFDWIGIDLQTANHNSFNIGAKIFWKLSNGMSSFKEMRAIQGHASQNDPRFRLGFPKGQILTDLEVVWLDGKKEKIDIKQLSLNKYHTITRQNTGPSEIK